jgi:type III secretion protein J
MTVSRRSPVLRVLLLASALALAGCKEVLYSDLSEIEANEMVAILDAGGIAAARQRSKDGAYDISVDGALVALSVTLLQSAGYPKQRYQSLGEVFAGDGLVGSAFSERARFMHAMNEELSRTIGQIDGVRSARVQVMIPEVDKYASQPKTATASVAVMHDARHDLSTLVPMIKTLVAHSVPDLAYDDVAVALFPVAAQGSLASPTAVTAPPAMRAMMFDLSPIWSGVLLGLLAASGLLALLTFMRRLQQNGPEEDENGGPAT